MSKNKASTTVILRYNGEGEWTKYHPKPVNGKLQVLMNRIPQCKNFDMMYPGCDRDKDNKFQCININLSQGEHRMSILTESQGWTTHFHSLVTILLCVVGVYAVVIGDVKVAGIVGFVALGNLAGAIGCLRQKLQAM